MKKVIGLIAWLASLSNAFAEVHPGNADEIIGVYWSPKKLLTGFLFTDNSYTNGKIYDPESGKTYECKMTLTDNFLKVRGYIGISLFGRTETFERIK